MLSSAIPGLLNASQSTAFMSGHLGYPHYLIPFLSVAKILGVIVLLVPGFPRLKEWAYAGFAFDLTGAVYSLISVGDAPKDWMPILIGGAILAGSYFLYHNRRSLRA